MISTLHCTVQQAFGFSSQLSISSALQDGIRLLVPNKFYQA